MPWLHMRPAACFANVASPLIHVCCARRRILPCSSHVTGLYQFTRIPPTPFVIFSPSSHMPLISPVFVLVCVQLTHTDYRTGISLVKDVAEAELFGTIRVSMRSLQRAVGPTRRIGACEPHQHTFSVPFAFPIAKARSSHFTSGSLAFQVML